MLRDQNEASHLIDPEPVNKKDNRRSGKIRINREKIVREKENANDPVSGLGLPKSADCLVGWGEH